VNSAYYKEKIVALKTKIGLYVVDLTDSSNTEVIEVAIQNSLETELASTQNEETKVDASIVEEPTCQEIDVSVEKEKTDAKNSSNDPVENLETIEIVNCTFCKDKSGALKNFKVVVDHIELHNCKFCHENLKTAIGLDVVDLIDSSNTEVIEVAIENSLETELASAQNEETKVECAEKNNKIQTLEIAKIKLETELASTQNALEEAKVECVEKINKIQTAKIKLETEVISAKKALEESKVESKVELEKVKNQLQIEVASKNSLKESLAKYQKLQQILATKIFQSNPSNENLISLLSLEVEKLFEKYEETVKFNDSNILKVEGEIDDTMKDKKLNLQILQRELYEKELDGIMQRSTDGVLF